MIHTIKNFAIIKALVQKITLAIFTLSSFCLHAQPLPEPILEYKLDNNYEDESLNGFDGAGFNGEFVDDYLGNPNSALSLNGTDTYVEFPDTPVLKPELPITIALRAKFDVMDQTQVLFTTDFALLHHSGVWLQVATENRLAAAFGNAVNGFNGSGRRGFFTDNAFDPDTWYNIVVVYTGPNDIRIYVDCELQEGFYTGTANNIGYTDAPGSLGRKRANPESISPPYYFEGDLDEFRMWDLELTEEQILGLCEVSPYDCPDFEANIGDPCEVNGTQGVLDDSCECITQLDFDVSVDGECPGDEFIFELVDVSDPAQIETVVWMVSGFDNFSGNPATLVINEPGNYNWEVFVTTVSGEVVSQTGSFEVLEMPNSEDIDLPAEEHLCAGETLQLDFTPYLDEWDSVLDSEGNELTDFNSSTPGVYEFTFYSPCITFQHELELTVAPDYAIESEPFGCLNSSVEVSLSPEINLENTDTELTIDWGDQTMPSTYDGLSTTHIYETTGTFDILVQGLIDDCPVDISSSIQVQDQPSLNLVDTTRLCLGDTFELDFSTFDFTIFDDTGFEVDIFETTTSGNYTFTAENFCGTDVESISVIFEEINPEVLDFPNTICAGVDTVSLGFEDSSYNFQWSDGSETPTITTTEPGNYAVLVTSNGTCTRDYSFAIGAQEPVDLSLFPDQTVELCSEGNRNIILPYLGFDYNFPDGSAGQEYYVEESQILDLNFSDGCYDYNLDIEIELYDCLCPVYIPNVFTPNGDGLNDIFKAVADCPLERFHMQIFNRWGNLVFESRDINRGWNGHSPNKSFYASHGVYFYIVTYSQRLDGLLMPTELTGHVTLLR